MLPPSLLLPHRHLLLLPSPPRWIPQLAARVPTLGSLATVPDPAALSVAASSYDVSRRSDGRGYARRETRWDTTPPLLPSSLRGRFFLFLPPDPRCAVTEASLSDGGHVQAKGDHMDWSLQEIEDGRGERRKKRREKEIGEGGPTVDVRGSPAGAGLWLQDQLRLGGCWQLNPLMDPYFSTLLLPTAEHVSWSIGSTTTAGSQEGWLRERVSIKEGVPVIIAWPMKTTMTWG